MLVYFSLWFQKKGAIVKKITFIVCIVTILLCSCSRKDDSDYLYFPKTKWGMSMEETLDAYGITEEETTFYQENSVFRIEGYELFDEKTSEIIFNFIDLKNGKPVLCDVKVSYPDSVDMNHVLEGMQKTYGKMILETSIYGLMQTLGEELPERKYTESEHLKLWASDSVIQSLPEKEQENYRERWKEYQVGLEDENWEIFSQKANLVTVIWSDNGEAPLLEKNGLVFHAFPLVVYDEIKSQLSGEE